MDCMNNVNYICRWRDAITDPPPDGWTGLGVTDLDGDECHSYVDDLRHYRDILVQWLDITDVPAVPRAAVQAAVDEIKEVYDIQCENEPAEDYNEGMDAALRTIKHHTGITPTVTP